MLSGLLFLWKPVSLADCADAGKLIGAVDTGGDGSGDSLCCWPGFYLICLPLPAICTVSLRQFVSSLVITRWSKITILRVTFRPHQCDLYQTSKSLPVVTSREVSGSGDFCLLFDMCHLLLRQWKWVCALEFTVPLHCFRPLCVSRLPKVEKDSVNGV